MDALIFTESTVNQRKYAAILSDYAHLYNYIAYLRRHGIVLQDNAPCHTVRNVRLCFAESDDVLTVVSRSRNLSVFYPVENINPTL